MLKFYEQKFVHKMCPDDQKRLVLLLMMFFLFLVAAAIIVNLTSKLTDADCTFIYNASSPGYYTSKANLRGNNNTDISVKLELMAPSSGIQQVQQILTYGMKSATSNTSSGDYTFLFLRVLQNGTLIMSNGELSLTSRTSIADNNWHSVSISKVGAKWTLTIDEKETDTFTADKVKEFYPTADFTIGGYSASTAAEIFKGSIRQVYTGFGTGIRQYPWMFTYVPV